MATVYSQGIEVSLKGLGLAQTVLKGMSKRLGLAIVRSINETVDYTVQQIPKEITKNYVIGIPSLLSRERRAQCIITHRYATEAEWRKPDGSVIVRSSRFPVMRFSVRPKEVPNQRGIPVRSRTRVTVRVVRGQIQSGRPNRFLARMQSGHLGVFMRKPDATHRVRPDRQRTQLNISEEHMISPTEMVESKRIRPVLQLKMMKQFDRSIRRNTKDLI